MFCEILNLNSIFSSIKKKKDAVMPNINEISNSEQNTVKKSVSAPGARYGSTVKVKKMKFKI